MRMCEQLPRFRLPDAEYEREPEPGACSECFCAIAPDTDYGMCDECKRAVLESFRLYLMGLSHNELDYLNEAKYGRVLCDECEAKAREALAAQPAPEEERQ